MAGNKNSGRRPERFLSEGEIKELLDGASLGTDRGRTVVMKRAVTMLLSGALQPRLFKHLGEGLETISRFGRQRALEKRVRVVRKAAEDIKRARLAGRNLRDVGEPPDDIGKRSETTT